MTLEAYDAGSPIVPLPAPADTDSWVEIVAHVSRLAGVISQTSFVPRGLRGDSPATTAAILYGREVGFAPMTALTMIHVVEGRPGMYAEGMRALVLSAGHEIVIEEATSAQCRIRGRRRGSSVWTPLVWTIDDARRAGLTGKDNWKKYPRAMLVARATTDLCRMLFPDVIHGFRSLEEFDIVEGADIVEDPSPSTRTVQRKRATTRKPVPPIEPARRSPGPVIPDPTEFPPLPGEGQETTATGESDALSDPSVVVPDGRETERPGEGTPSPVPDPGENSDDAGEDARRSRVEDPSSDREASDHTTTPPDSGETEAEAVEQTTPPRLVNRPTLRLMFREFNRLGVSDDQRDKRLQILADIVSREIRSSSELTQDEATRVLTMVSAVGDLRALATLLEMGTVIEDEPDDPLPIEQS
jgi:hypothetical protein